MNQCGIGAQCYQHCPKRVDGTRFNNRLVKDLKKDLDSKILSWMASLVNKDEKGGRTMIEFCGKVKVFFKSGIKSVVVFCKNNKNTIIRLVGKLVIYVCKTVIELFLDDLF